MSLVDDILKSHEELQIVLQKVTTVDLVKALSTRVGVITQCEMGVRVLMISESMMRK